MYSRTQTGDVSVGLTIEGRDNSELPEQILGCFSCHYHLGLPDRYKLRVYRAITTSVEKDSLITTSTHIIIIIIVRKKQTIKKKY